MLKPAFLLAALVVLPAAPAWAASKVWVSQNGFDNLTCGAVASPCRTLQQAHDNVAAAGDIGVLTPGDYSFNTSLGLHITKSVNVTNDGVGEASILVSNTGAGIFIQAGAGDVISLRGLVIDGQISGGEGIALQTGSALHVQNCVIRNFEAGQGDGINMENSGNTQLFVSDTIVFNNGFNSFSGGIVVAPQSAGTVNAVLDRVHLENNIDGLRIDGTLGFGGGIGSHVIVRDSVLSGNAGSGIHALTGGHAAAFAVVTRSSMVNNKQNGILADGARATLLLNDSTVTRNSTGINTINSGQLISYGNNRINNNIGPDGTPTGLFTQD